VNQCVGSNEQYPDLEVCLLDCGIWPAGDSTDVDAEAQNTRWCRWHQLLNDDPTQLALNCPHASGVSLPCGRTCKVNNDSSHPCHAMLAIPCICHSAYTQIGIL
jgi:hypothetical protein